MQLLPKWVLTENRPAIYDSESATAIQQTAKLYGAVQELIGEYNGFSEKVNAEIDSQNNIIDDAVDYMKTNLQNSTEEYINLLIKNGSLQIEEVYNEQTESLELRLGKFVLE